MTENSSDYDFSKVNEYEYKQCLFLTSTLYSLELKIKYIENLIENKADDEQQFLLNQFKKHLEPIVPKPDHGIYIPFGGDSPEVMEKREIESFGVQPDIPVAQRGKHNYGLDVHRLVNWIDELLALFIVTPHTKIKCHFYPSEFAFLFKLLLEKGWIEANFNGKTNLTKLSKILLDTFEIRNPEGDLVTASALADKFNQQRNKASELFKKDIKTGINDIVFYRKSKPKELS